MRFFIAVLVGKLLRWGGSLIGRSTNLPGQFVLKICPDFYKRLKVKGQVLAVTGSNGKTTTTNLTAYILRKQGYKVLCNTEGANMVTGIASTLVQGCTLSGELNYDYLVLEVDERHARLIFKDLKLDIFLINNLLRDQVVRNGNPDLVMEKISQAVGPEVKLVLNACDPISQQICPENERVLFGMAQTDLSSEENEFITQDCKVCPKCFHSMDYEYYHYNHIGQFHCDHCGYETPKADYYAENVNYRAGTFTINGHPACVTYRTTFHFLNTTAAVAACCTAGVPLEEAIKAASSFQVSRERFEEFDVGGRKAVLIMTKQNPVSLDQSISYVLGKPEQKTVVLFVNNVIYMENKDISWLYDVTFERLQGHVDYIVCGGSRAYDVGVRLKLAGFDDGVLKIENELAKVREAIESTTGSIYVLAASAFGNEDGILEVLKQK